MSDRAAGLELAILGLLKQQELHGYELKKRLVDTLGMTSAVSFGSLYPALARLELAGSVKAVEAASRPPIPHTGSLGGELAAFRARVVGARPSRGKKVYGITEAGERRFSDLLAGDLRGDDDDRAFTLRLAFARYLPVEVRIRLLERRRMHLVERLSMLASRLRAGRDRLDAYGRILLEHDHETTEHDIAWLDRLIAAERGASPGSTAATGSGAAGAAGATGSPRPTPLTVVTPFVQDPSLPLEDHHP